MRKIPIPCFLPRSGGFGCVWTTYTLNDSPAKIPLRWVDLCQYSSGEGDDDGCHSVLPAGSDPLVEDFRETNALAYKVKLISSHRDPLLGSDRWPAQRVLGCSQV